MAKTLSKAIMTRSKLRPKYNKWQSKEIFLPLGKQKLITTIINKMSKKAYFEQMTRRGLINKIVSHFGIQSNLF